MPDPVVAPSVRVTNPVTIEVGVGLPELVHAGASYSVNDAFTVGGQVGVGVFGVGGTAYGMWHALRSPNHGHSMYVRPAVLGAPAVDGGTPMIGGELALGWEYRSQVGFTARAQVGALGYALLKENGERAVAPTGSLSVGWSF